jgi:hypothetical protein
MSDNSMYSTYEYVRSIGYVQPLRDSSLRRDPLYLHCKGRSQISRKNGIQCGVIKYLSLPGVKSAQIQRGDFPMSLLFTSFLHLILPFHMFALLPHLHLTYWWLPVETQETTSAWQRYDIHLHAVINCPHYIHIYAWLYSTKQQFKRT